MQLKVLCCSCFFDLMLKVKHCSSDLIRKAVDGDMFSCFKLYSFQSQCNFEMETCFHVSSCVHFNLNVILKWKERFL